MDELDRPDVETARRLRGDQHLRVALDLACEHDLLLVAAGEPAARRRGAAAADVEVLDQLARALDEPAREEPAEARGGRRAIVVEGDVLGDRVLEHEPAPLPVLRDVAEPRLQVAGAVSVVTSSPSTRTEPPLTPRSPVRPSISSVWPFPSIPASADDLPRAHLERDTADLLDPAVVVDLEVLDLSSGSAGRAAVLATRSRTSRPTIRRARLSSVAPSAGSVSISFPRRRTVIRSATSSTSFSLCVMKITDLPRSVSDADDLEELLRLLRREHRRRLVEDEDVRLAVERLEDLDALLLADGDVLDPRARVDGEPVAVGDLADAPLRLAHVEEDARARRLLVEHDVLGDGHHRDEHEVLVHHADARLDRRVRRAEAHRASP